MTKKPANPLIPWLAPLGLLAACIAAYGLLAPWLGLYWDDWPKTLFYETLGAGAFTRVASHRPLNGWWYAVLLKLVGVQPLFWQAMGIFWHWASAVAAWGLVRSLWPGRRDLAFGSALLFAVYPGFTQSSIALTYFIHFAAYTLFFLSLIATVQALRSPSRRIWWHALALALSAATMLTTDYYYGLELVRPLIIWLVLRPQMPTWRGGLVQAIKQASPYLLLVAALFAWRSQLAAYTSYEITIFEQLQFGSGLETLSTILGDLWQAALLSWQQALLSLVGLQWRSVVGLTSLGLLTASAIALYWLLAKTGAKDSQEGKRLGSRGAPIILGLGALALAGIPSWVTGLGINLGFPGDRLMVPLAFGACLLLAALLYALPVHWRVQALAVAALAALAISFQFQTANNFRIDGDRHADFWQQLIWRVPGLLPGTTILSDELPLKYFSDDSLTGALNLIYPYDDHVNGLPYLLVYIDLRMGGVLPSLEMDESILRGYRYFDFIGSTSQALVIEYQPPGCLRVLDPAVDTSHPDLSQDLRAALPLSSFAQIVPEPELPAQLPDQVHPVEGEDRWCYYFQRADLARQLKHWDTIIDLAEEALAQTDGPQDPVEYIPFIEGYAQTGDWVPAIELTRAAIGALPGMRPMLCDTWQRVADEEPVHAQESETLEQINRELECGF